MKNTLGDNLNNLEGLKVLGVRWNPESDSLLFDIQHITELATKLQPTKRNVIGLAARFFDPLGVISPVTVQFKLLFQNICVKNVSWDEPLPCELLERWEKLLDGLKQGHSITIPRCYFSNWTSCSLRGFCDASQHAYAAVVYLRIETDGSCYSKLVVAKTRVCPLQKHSIPRLELLGALLLSRLLSWVHSALRVELRLEPSICYTDSIVVLYWIKRVDKEWKQFVENRVTEIRRLAPAVWWQHCPGADNPADMPSRGMDPLQLVNNPLWFQWSTLTVARWPDASRNSRRTSYIATLVVRRGKLNNAVYRPCQFFQPYKDVLTQTVVNLPQPNSQHPQMECT